MTYTLDLNCSRHWAEERFAGRQEARQTDNNQTNNSNVPFQHKQTNPRRLPPLSPVIYNNVSVV
jgi:hypothetical protein